MDFDAVEAGGKRVSGRAAVLLDDGRNFLGLKRARRDARLEAGLGIRRSRGADRRRCHRQRAAGLQRWMRHAADMLELYEHPAAFGVNRLGHEPPSLDLRRCVEARGECIASPLRRDIGSFRDDQAG